MVGQALAASIVDGLPDGSRRFVGGRPQRVTPGHDAITLVLPDGTPVATAGLPLGDLVAARRASGAPTVVAAPLGRTVAPSQRGADPAAVASPERPTPVAALGADLVTAADGELIID